ncbi:tyrosine-type recombinase/integrase, partial [bacterium]|nr:tyrosine-type recombinase/integrase [bacterium]
PIKRIMNQNHFITINSQQQKALLQSTPSKKYRVVILLLLDCGLRVSELIKLQCQHILFAQNKIRIESSNKERIIPMTQRLLKSLADYWTTLNETNPDSYIFPAGKNSKIAHIGRKQIWKIVNRLSKGKINPTILRNTFANRIVQENELSVAKELLGDPSLEATQRHVEITESQRETAIESIEQNDFITKLYRKFFPTQTIHIIPTEIGITNFHIGRKEEMQKLHDCGKKKINLLITGEQGIGKSHLLDNYNYGNLIRIGDLSITKKMIAGLLLHLFETDKESIAKTLYEKQLNKNDIDTLVYRETIKRMTEMLIQITEQHEYTLLIDDVTRIPPTGVLALEKLKNHFHIICAARRIPMTKSSFLTNFERIEIKPLSRPESIELINRVSQPTLQKIEDYETYKNHIFENTNGNPLFMIEMIERYSKESEITLEVIRDYRHTSALKEFDFSLVLVIILSSLMVLRYISGELGDDSGAMRLFGGIFLMFALFARNIFRAGVRKYV